MLAIRIGRVTFGNTVLQVYHRCYKCLRSCYASCWRVLLHKTAHPTAESFWCVYIDVQPKCMALKLGITVGTLKSIEGLHKRSVLLLHMAPKRTLETLLAATTQQVGPPPTSGPPRCPDTLSSEWEFGVDAWGDRIPRDRIDSGPCCGWSKRPRPRCGHLTVEHSRQSVKECEAQAAAGDKTICHQPAGDDAHHCRDELRRARHTPVMHNGPRPLSLRGPGTIHHFRLDADFASLDRVLARHL